MRLSGSDLSWENAAGVSWSLEIRDTELWAGEDCPYGEQKLSVALDGSGTVSGLYFGGELYARVK